MNKHSNKHTCTHTDIYMHAYVYLRKQSDFLKSYIKQGNKTFDFANIYLFWESMKKCEIGAILFYAYSLLFTLIIIQLAVHIC